MTKFILVVGSKPNSSLPEVEVDWIFSSNGSAEKADDYCDKVKKVSHTCIVGSREFEKNLEVSDRVTKSNTTEIIFRFGYIDISNFKFNSNTKITFYSKLKQFVFQKQFFKSSTLDLIISELMYKETIFEKIKYFFYCLRTKGFLCSSTGLFSILYALNKFPDHNIIISGIGPSNDISTHFYDKKTNYKFRSRVDENLFLRMKKKYKERLFSTDKKLCDKINISFWSNDTYQ